MAIKHRKRTQVIQDNIEDIINLYVNEHWSLTRICKKYGCTQITVGKFLQENGVKLRSFREAKRLYPFDIHYFDEINTKDKAYFLGFLYADGCVFLGPHGQHMIQWSSIDKECLDLFKQYIHSEKPLQIEKARAHKFKEKEYLCKQQYTLSISSVEMYNALNRYGCVPNKTFLLNKLPDIPEEFISHFIRGYFDGDGSVHSLVYNKARNAKWGAPPTLGIGCCICGTNAFLKDFRKHLPIEGNMLYQDKRKTTDCWVIRMSGKKRCKQFYDYIYQNCDDLFLKRKKEKFEELL